MPRTVVVIPCFNEEKRLLREELLQLANHGELSLLFINDGSTDGTEASLRELARCAETKIEVLSLEENSGKAEAVRFGLLRALETDAEIVGYVDADLSTPVDEILRLLSEMESRHATVVMGARVARLGAQIERKASRHYLGRVFATVASIVLDLPVYDTQCGAKFIRRTPRLGAALYRPFLSRWAFDVELIGRLLKQGGTTAPLSREDFLEVPLRRWVDKPGSKLSFANGVKAGLSLLAIGASLRVSGIAEGGVLHARAPGRNAGLRDDGIGGRQTATQSSTQDIEYSASSDRVRSSVRESQLS